MNYRMFKHAYVIFLHVYTPGGPHFIFSPEERLVELAPDPEEISRRAQNLAKSVSHSCGDNAPSCSTFGFRERVSK